MIFVNEEKSVIFQNANDAVRERKEVTRMACLLCGTEHALVITRDAYNGHIRGVCEACGAKMIE